MPTLAFGSFGSASATGTTVFFRAGASGAFTVTGSSADPESGIRHLSFPSLGAGWTGGGADSSDPYEGVYSFGGAAADPAEPNAVTATNNADLTSAPSSFTVTPDGSAPTSTIACDGGACSEGWYGAPVSVSLSGSDTGSGLDKIKYATTGADPSPVTGTVYVAPFAVGHTTSVRFRAYDRVGNEEPLASERIQVDTTPPSAPALSFGSFASASATGSTVYYRPGAASGSFQVTASSSDAESGIAGYAFASAASGWTRSVDGAAATYSHSGSPADPAEPNDVTTRNQAGHASAPGTYSVTPDASAPTSSIQCNGAACSSEAYGSSVQVSLSATDAGSGLDRIRYTLDGSEPSASDGTLYSAAFEVGATAEIKFRAYDKVGNEGAVVSQTVQVGGGPTLNPTPLDPGAVTSLADATSFIYEGPGAVQTGVAPGAISPRRIAVLRGLVLDEAGEPFPGVKVTVLDHGEYGQTFTRADGRFDMVVNGARLDLVYEKDGYPTVQRQIDALWQDYLVADEVTMVPFDDKVTVVDPSSTEPFQVVESSLAPGSTGNPSALLFPEGAAPEMQTDGGGTEALDQLSVRITEYPPNTAALPGTMPGNVGPTYAVEFTVDEAGDNSVTFAKPVINYADNFIGAPVGSPVPTAWYDRDRGEWVPSRNGRVVKVVSEAGGLAELDGATGLAITDDERRKLAELYDAPQELWRVPIEHFTPWDHNWPYGPPQGAEAPKLKEFEWKDPNDPCNRQGSVIACEAQTLGEEIPLTGTTVTLNYASNRTPGYKVPSRLEVPITDATVPDGLKNIILEIDVAGRRFEERWCDPGSPYNGEATCRGFPDIAPNLSYTFEWDGKDAYGREVQGRPVATVRVNYVYEFVYYEAPEEFEQSFAQLPAGGADAFSGWGFCTANVFRYGGAGGGWSQGLWERLRLLHHFCGIVVPQTVKRSLGSWETDDVDGLGGLTLSVHHGYDPQEGVVHRGDGTTIRSEPLGSVLHNLAGGGSGFPANEPRPALDVSVDHLGDIAVGPEGSIYGHSGLNQNHIWRLTPDGQIRRIGGRDCDPFAEPPGPECPEEGNPSGDGGPAIGAILGNSVRGLAVAPDGSVYFAVSGVNTATSSVLNGYIRRIAPDGTLSTVAGIPWIANAATAGQRGDGGPARNARINDIGDLELGVDGSLYFSERGGHTNGHRSIVRRISPSGIVTTAAGGGIDNAADDQDLGAGEPARQQDLRVIYGIAAAPDGTLYLADPTARRVQKVGPDGILTRVVGDGGATVEYGQVGVAAGIGDPTHVALGPDGALYVRTNELSSPGSKVKLVRIDRDGTVQPIAGRRTAPIGCSSCLGVEGESANGALIESHTTALEVAPDGTLLFTDGRHQVRQIRPALPGFGVGTDVIPSPDGSEAYIFDLRGRHLKTLDGLTGAVRWEFDYDASHRLAAVRDGDGNSLQIERAADGRPQALVAPGGHRTTLALDGAGRVDGVTNSAGETTSIGYESGGLLTTFTRPGGRTSRYEYDALGRLVRAENAVGAVQQLTRTETLSAITVAVSSGEGRVTKYTTEALDNGDRRRTVERPSGATTRLTVTPERTRVSVAPDGTTTTQIPGPDPRWGMRAPVPLDEVTRTPAGRTMHTTVTRETEPSQPENPFAIDSMSTRITRVDDAGFDDEETEIIYDAVERTIETESPEERHSLTTLDTHGRVVRVEPDTAFGSTLAPITIAYDANGRVQRTTQGSQSWTFAYDASNRLQSRTDAGGSSIGYSYDLAGRLTQERYPGGRTYTYAYRPGDGRLESVTMPEGQVHQFEADAEGRPIAYRPPLAPAAYRRAYNRENALDLFTFPSGAMRDPAFDAGGREESTEYGPERDAFAYPAAQERASSLTRTPDSGTGQRLDHTYDGLLTTGSTSSGPASGAYTFDFGAKFRLAAATLTSGADTAHTTTFAYDKDGLPTTYGPFTLTREASGGAVSTVSDGTLNATFAYDGLGRIARRELAVGSTTQYKAELTYDSRGRITRRVETIGAGTRTLDYGYDDNGELTQVKDGATVLEAYGYDRNGNRTTPAATYDAGDRLVQRGGTSYTFDADGFLAARGADTFTYSPSGALLSARVGATTVTYAYDALGRRTARTQGATEQYLYGDPTNPFKVTASRTAAGELTTYYYDQADALFALERGGTRYYVGSDQVGTPKVVFAGDGTIVKRLVYDSYGDLISDSDPAFELPIGFAGGLADPATGLVRFGLRDYDPKAGRFTARDPIFFEGSPFNLYAYAGSNPIGKRDPTGLLCVGGSFYSGVGGGIQYCYKEGKHSVCDEVGVGAGGGVELDPFGDVASDGATLVAEVTGKWGPASGTLGFETDLDCFNTKGSAKVGLAVGISAGVDTEGGFSSSLGGAGKNDFNYTGERTPDGKWGAGTEGKVAVKACGQF